MPPFVSALRDGSDDPRPHVVAIGGGHGLAATLSALHRLPVYPIAVVGTADDGGSSGRLRIELNCLPPGDMRMALGALLGDTPEAAAWRELMHQRFPAGSELQGHAIGNLMLVALLHEHDPVTALTRASRLLGIDGLVLPAAVEPLDLEAEVRGADSDASVRSIVRGQVAIARTTGHVEHVRVLPDGADAAAEVVDHVRSADVVVLGPGSWWTSVIPPLLLPSLRRAVVETDALKVLVLNLGAQPGETSGYTAASHMHVLNNVFPELDLDVVIADEAHTDDVAELKAAATLLGATVVLADVARVNQGDKGDLAHDPELLSEILCRVLDTHGRINTCP